MKILQSSYEIIDKLDRDKILKKIEACGRICYQSEHKVGKGTAGPFVSKLVSSGHHSVLEHFSFSVLFTVDRGVTHEQVRHRIASFSQESTRYCSYDGDQYGSEINVIDIREGIKLDTKMKNMSVHLINEILNEWEHAMEDAERHYMRMIQLGATPQIARSVLPNSVKASIAISANLREWRTILTQRCSKAAHPQMREVMLPFLAELVVVLPEVFGDIKVN